MLHFKIGSDIQEFRFSIHAAEKNIGQKYCNIVLSKYPFIKILGVKIARVTRTSYHFLLLIGIRCILLCL